MSLLGKVRLQLRLFPKPLLHLKLSKRHDKRHMEKVRRSKGRIQTAHNSQAYSTRTHADKSDPFRRYYCPIYSNMVSKDVSITPVQTIGTSHVISVTQPKTSVTGIGIGRRRYRFPETPSSTSLFVQQVQYSIPSKHLESNNY